MSHVKEPCHANKWATSHMNASCHKNEWVMSHLQNIGLIWWAVGLFWFEAHYRSVWRSHVTDEWMLSQAHYTSLSRRSLPYLQRAASHICAKKKRERKINTCRCVNWKRRRWTRFGPVLLLFLSGGKTRSRDVFMDETCDMNAFMSQINEPCHTCMSYVTHDWVMSHIRIKQITDPIFWKKSCQRGR